MFVLLLESPMVQREMQRRGRKAEESQMAQRRGRKAEESQMAQRRGEKAEESQWCNAKCRDGGYS